MKLEVDDDSNSSELNKPDSLHKVSLPTGLWFSEIRSMELVFDKEELPFMWLRGRKKRWVSFYCNRYWWDYSKLFR